MYRKLGSSEKFQNTLEKSFQSSVAAFQDDNPRNDQPTLRQLCNILACLPSLKEEAAIAISSQFYVLDTKPEKVTVIEGSDENRFP